MAIDHDNDPELDEEDYHESEDEDFDPQAAPAADNVSSDGEDDDDDELTPATSQLKTKKRGKKVDKAGQDAEDLGLENSGDEAVVKKGARRKRRHHADAEEDSGGEGGFVKTRSMRATAAQEQSRRPLATTAGATVDVDALWAQMNSPHATAAPPPAHAETIDADSQQTYENGASAAKTESSTQRDTIEVEETYKFAGELHKRKKLVARSSDEAQRWLKAQVTPADGVVDAGKNAKLAKAKRHPDTGEPLLRPLRRVSLWDPNPDGVVKGLPTNVLSDSTAGNRLRVVDKSRLGWHTETATKAAKTTKLNVVEKSKMDWQAHVDAAGDKEELEKAARAKGSYLARKDFLERVDARREEEERRLRFK